MILRDACYVGDSVPEPGNRDQLGRLLERVIWILSDGNRCTCQAPYRDGDVGKLHHLVSDDLALLVRGRVADDRGTVRIKDDAEVAREAVCWGQGTTLLRQFI